MPKRDIVDFISHWKDATASEQSISQQFLCELCDLLDVPQPDNRRNGSYSFEFHVSEPQHDGSTKEGRIDLYKRACFILESKKFQEKVAEQTDLELSAEKFGAIAKRKKSAAPVRDTARWDDAMLKALLQAERYTRALPADEPYPPFVLVVDVGHVIEVRADFSLTGRAYQPFPDPLTYRIPLEKLRDEKVRERLKFIWTNPLALDPSKRSAEVTREVAKHLAELAKSFEKAGHAPKVVAEFLTRCLFCMFAEDVGLLPNADGKRGFTALLNSLSPDGAGFVEMLRTLFKEMNEGRKNEISVILRRKLLKFNGGLFADDTVLPVNGTQLGILKKAAELDWQHVEPAIFGTLLERALGGEGERHKLGAHFTPRTYVERLVLNVRSIRHLPVDSESSEIGSGVKHVASRNCGYPLLLRQGIRPLRWKRRNRSRNLRYPVKNLQHPLFTGDYLFFISHRETGAIFPRYSAKPARGLEGIAGFCRGIAGNRMWAKTIANKGDSDFLRKCHGFRGELRTHPLLYSSDPVKAPSNSSGHAFKKGVFSHKSQSLGIQAVGFFAIPEFLVLKPQII